METSSENVNMISNSQEMHLFVHVSLTFPQCVPGFKAINYLNALKKCHCYII